MSTLEKKSEQFVDDAVEKSIELVVVLNKVMNGLKFTAREIDLIEMGATAGAAVLSQYLDEKKVNVSVDKLV